MRVARLHLVADRPRDVVEREMAGFLRHARVEYDLEQQIAELAVQLVHVSARDSVGDLVRFLDRVRCDRFERLRDIPVAAALRVAEAGHDREEAV